MSYFYPRASVELNILPEDFSLRSDASKQQTFKIICQASDITVNINDYKTTDTFSFDVDYKNFPFDPRTIRACGVVIYMQDMGSLYDEYGNLKRLIPGEVTKQNPNISNGVFIGFADEDEITLDEGSQKVKLTGRDCTALLIDQKYDHKGPLFPNKPLDVVLTQLLAEFPATKDIKVIIGSGVSTPLPVLSSLYDDFGSKLAGGVNTGGGTKESYWDIIQSLVHNCGLICYMSTTSQNGKLYPALILSNPKNQSIGIDPSTGKQKTDTIDDIKIIYGKNIKKLTLKRKLGRLKNFNISVRCRVGKNVLIAKIPLEANASWCKDYGIQKAEVHIPVLKPDGTVEPQANHPAPYIAFPATKVSNKDQLILIGQSLYEQYSVQQLEGSFETHEMEGRGTTIDSNLNNKASFRNYDLTKIQKGQTICVEISTEDLDGISRLKSVAARIDYLKLHGYADDVASIFATTLAKMSPRFQIKSYSMNMSDAGFKLSGEFHSIITLEQRNITR